MGGTANPCRVTTFDLQWNNLLLIPVCSLNPQPNQYHSTVFKSFVQKINSNSLEIKDKPKLEFDMAIWCGGIKISDLSLKINKSLQLENNRGIPVDKYLHIQGQNNLFAIHKKSPLPLHI